MTSAPSPSSPLSALVSVRWSGGRHGKPPEDRRAGLSKTSRRAFGRKKPSGASSEKGVSPAHLHSGTRSSPHPPITPSPVLRSKLRRRAAACGTCPGANCRPPKMTKAAQGEPQASKQGEGEDVLGTFGEPQACFEALKRVGRGRQALFLLPTLPPRPSPTTLLAPSTPFKLTSSSSTGRPTWPRTLPSSFASSSRCVSQITLSSQPTNAPQAHATPLFLSSSSLARRSPLRMGAVRYLWSHDHGGLPTTIRYLRRYHWRLRH